MRAGVLLSAGLALVLSGCSGAPKSPTFPAGTVRFGPSPDRVSLDVRIAEDDAARAQGLMGVTTLPDDTGMAFVWPEPTDDTFWMKNTLIPLSIAFVDGGGRIVTLRDMTPCRAEPCPTYSSDSPYVLAIEANEGWFADRGVDVGDRAALEATGD
jgi:uncharacterized membrane protein (UPF0127 family)